MKIAGERFTALVVQASHGRAHLIVRVARNILHQEIDQTRIALENSEYLQSAVGRLHLRLRLRDRLRLDLGKTERLGDVGRQFTTEQNGKKTTESEGDT